MTRDQARLGATAKCDADPIHRDRVVYITRAGDTRYGAADWFFTAKERTRGLFVERITYAGKKGG